MLGARTLVAVLVLFHVGLLTVAAGQSADFAWVPSYFDDDDGDFLPPFGGRMATGLAAPHLFNWVAEYPILIVLALIVLAVVLGWRPRPRPYLVAVPARFRAPPCP